MTERDKYLNRPCDILSFDPVFQNGIVSASDCQTRLSWGSIGHEDIRKGHLGAKTWFFISNDIQVRKSEKGPQTRTQWALAQVGGPRATCLRGGQPREAHRPLKPIKPSFGTILALNAWKDVNSAWIVWDLDERTEMPFHWTKDEREKMEIGLGRGSHAFGWQEERIWRPF